MMSAGLASTYGSGPTPKPLRPPPTRQGLRATFAWLRLDEELRNVDCQRACETIKQGDRRILEFTFQAAHVRAIDLRISGELFLG
jgi:hypothetical protein